jgi:hypothetical protein
MTQDAYQKRVSKVGKAPREAKSSTPVADQADHTLASTAWNPKNSVEAREEATTELERRANAGSKDETTEEAASV